MLAAAALVAGGCAPALPALAGASTTPARRVDVAVGAASRIPYGALRDAENHGSRAVAAGGIAPVAVARVGLSRRVELGAVAAGTTGGASVRWSAPLVEGPFELRLTLGATPYAGAWSTDGGRSGARMGLDAPVVLGADVSSLFSAWLGARVGVERTTGDVTATGVRAGGLVGLGLGFRHVHALVELGVHWESWAGDARASGVVLAPAFALRLRI